MKKNKIVFGSKKEFKRYSHQCQICGEKEYKLLDVHRIKEGGDYSYENCVCLCTRCHRKNHTNIISVIGWMNSTKGRVLLYLDENGQEQFI